jgi:hypothetical protein
MRTHAAFLFLFLVGCVETGQPAPKGNTVRFPELVSPVPLPTAVSDLPADRMYYVASNEDVLVVDSPEGLVKLVHKKGPVSVGAKWVDGTGGFEFREFPEKNVTFVVPVAKGKVELLVVGTDRSVTRKSLSVLGGGGPSPSPDPPTPEELTQFQKDLQDAYSQEKDAALLGDLRTFYSKSRTAVDGQTTWVGLFREMTRIAEQETKTLGKLPKTQRVISAELSKVFPTGTLSPSLALTAEDKVKVKATFDMVTTALSKIK